MSPHTARRRLEDLMEEVSTLCYETWDFDVKNLTVLLSSIERDLEDCLEEVERACDTP